MDKITLIFDDLDNNKISIKEALSQAYNMGVTDMCDASVDKAMRMSTTGTPNGKHTYMKAVGTNMLDKIKQEKLIIM